LSEHIESVAIEIDKRAHKFILANIREKHLEKLSEKKLNQLIIDQENFYDYIHKEVVTVFNELVDQIGNIVSA
jgi:hypothetical protein